MEKKRIAKWDNVKLLLIFLVVLGHVCDRFTDPYRAVRALFMFIYTFHMPAFLMVSGLFAKRTVLSDRLNLRKVAPYAVLGVFLYFYRFLSIYLFDRSRRVDLSGQNNISWYLFVLAAFMIIAWLLRNLDPKYVLTVSVLLAIIAGYDNSIGSDYALSRTIVLFPFFYLGVTWDREKLEAVLSRKNVRLASLGVLLLFAAVCLVFTKQVYWFRTLVTAQNPYSALPFSWQPVLGLARLIWYAVAVLLTLAVFSIIPDKHIPVLSSMGSQTLSIYFWHLPILYIICMIPAVQTAVSHNLALWVVFAVLLSSVLVVLLSHPVFARPLNAILHPKLREDLAKEKGS